MIFSIIGAHCTDHSDLEAEQVLSPPTVCRADRRFPRVTLLDGNDLA